MRHARYNFRAVSMHNHHCRCIAESENSESLLTYTAVKRGAPSDEGAACGSMRSPNQHPPAPRGPVSRADTARRGCMFSSDRPPQTSPDPARIGGTTPV